MRNVAAILASALTLAVGSMPAHTSADDTAPSPHFQIDLSKHINHSLYEGMLKTDGNDLAGLAGAATTETPRKTLKGIPFRLDGVIMVGPGESSNGTTGVTVPVAKKVEGIPVNRKVQQLHFLHGTHWFADKGTKIGAYIVHYADGTTAEIPIRYGVDLLDWWAVPDPQRGTEAAEGQIAWTGSNDASRRIAAEINIRLYLKTWKNPNPNTEIKSLDVVTGDQKSGTGAPVPFLVAVTAQ